ncbi:hypothetical protein D3C84_952100 [compost metagenome]
MNDNARQHQTLYLHPFKNGIQFGANEGAVFLFDDDGFSLYRGNVFLDAIPRAMDVIAGCRSLFIVLHVKHRPTIRSPVIEKALDHRQVPRIIFAIPIRAINGVLNVKDNKGGRARLILHVISSPLGGACTPNFDLTPKCWPDGS